MVSAHPADSGGGGVPPLLVQQECLDDQIERRLLPCRIGEPTVLGQRFDRGGCSRIVEASSDIIGQAPIFSRGLGAQRSEEHTSELQSLMRISYAVFCLKKKKIH